MCWASELIACACVGTRSSSSSFERSRENPIITLDDRPIESNYSDIVRVVCCRNTLLRVFEDVCLDGESGEWRRIEGLEGVVGTI